MFWISIELRGLSQQQEIKLPHFKRCWDNIFDALSSLVRLGRKFLDGEGKCSRRHPKQLLPCTMTATIHERDSKKSRLSVHPMSPVTKKVIPANFQFLSLVGHSNTTCGSRKGYDFSLSLLQHINLFYPILVIA